MEQHQSCKQCFDNPYAIHCACRFCFNMFAPDRAVTESTAFTSLIVITREVHEVRYGVICTVATYIAICTICKTNGTVLRYKDVALGE